MNRNEFITHVNERTTTRVDLLRTKGQAYSGDADAFANFKRNAEKLGLSRYQIWAVYCGKHLDAIFGSIKRDPNSPVDKSEGLQGRIDDAINYLDLLSGMVHESPNGAVPTQKPDIPTNQHVAEYIAQLLGGNGLSTNRQIELIVELLNDFYGPRNFSL